MATVDDADMHGPGPAPGETTEQHVRHASVPATQLWGLSTRAESALFYCEIVLSWMFEIAAAALAGIFDTQAPSFIATATIWLVLWAAAWLQTVTSMIQVSSWFRDESNLKDRKRYLDLAVRLQRLMLPTAIIAFVTFVVAYVRRYSYQDLAYWLIFLLLFVLNTVGCVMNAYNNIGWESDRLHYEEREPPYKKTWLALLGIPS